MSDARNDDIARRAPILLMIGSRGTGITMQARRLPTILPPLTPTESLKTTRIYSALGRLKTDEPLLAMRPFRPPHHTLSDAGMVGGGSISTPSDLSLAHHAVLFLDELPEFHRRSLDVLRQPLEEGKLTISRALTSTTFPADFILAAAMNPCPCGYALGAGGVLSSLLHEEGATKTMLRASPARTTTAPNTSRGLCNNPMNLVP